MTASSLDEANQLAADPDVAVHGRLLVLVERVT
jgi:hypothetical protein